MTNSAFETFNAYLPYDKKLDVLIDPFQSTKKASLRCIPESADSNLRGGEKGGSTSEENSPSGDSLNSGAREKFRTSII